MQTCLVKTNDDVAIEQGCYFDLPAAERVRDFFRKYLRHTDGQFAGKPFDLLPWQWERVIKPLFGWKMPDGTRRFRECYIFIPKKNGKPLACNTPILTTHGYKPLNDIVVGDKVFTPSGLPSKVIAVSEVMHDKVCYEITYSNGERIIAASDHNWPVRDRQQKYAGVKIVPTDVIAATQKCSDGANRYSYKVADSLMCGSNYIELPVDPYTLGYYLGNGHTAGTQLAVSDLDLPHVTAKLSGKVALYNNGPNCKNVLVEGLKQSINQFGFVTYKDKHIPDMYYTANVAQRFALLQGLMDSDGCAGPKGQCIYTTGCEKLLHSVRKLLSGLGIKSTYNYVDDTWREDRNCSGHWRILFTANQTTPVFGLERKQRLLPLVKSTNGRSSTVSIVGVKQVTSVSVKCIEIEDEEHIFLAGDMLVPTHNSTLIAAIGAYLLCADKEPGAQIYSAAADRNQAGLIYNQMEAMVKDSKALSSVLQIRNSKKTIRFPPNNSFYRVLSSDGFRNEGYNIHALLFDEVHTQRDRRLWAALRYGGAARRQPINIVISTAGENDESQLWHEQFTHAKKIQSQEIIDIHTLGVVYCAEPDDNWTDPEVWKKANPSWGETLDETGFRLDFENAKKSASNEADFKRYRLNLATTLENAWIKRSFWDDCQSNYIPVNATPAFYGLDLSDNTDLNALCELVPVIHPERGDCLQARFWYYAPINCNSNTGIGNIERYKRWTEAGYLKRIGEHVVEQPELEDEIIEILMNRRVAEIGIDRYNATRMAYSMKLKLKNIDHVSSKTEILRLCPYTFAAMNDPVKFLEELIFSGRLLHHGDPVTSWMFDNISCVKDSSGNKKLDKSHATKKIDGFAALCIAAYLLINKEPSFVSKYTSQRPSSIEIN